MGRFLFLVNTPNPRPSYLDRLDGHRFDFVQQYELDRLDLAPFDGLVLTMHSDQIHLAENRARLGAYLDAGGAVIFNGHVVHPFLPELSIYRPVASCGRESYRIHRLADHRLFDGLGSDDLSFQCGVMGFYGRGWNPAPPDAVRLNGVGPDREPVDWLLERPSGGRLFVHAGNDMFSFLDRVAPQGRPALQSFFDWFVKEQADAAHGRN